MADKNEPTTETAEPAWDDVVEILMEVTQRIVALEAKVEALAAAMAAPHDGGQSDGRE